MLPRTHGPVLKSSDLLAELARIRRRRRWMVALYLGFVPVTATVGAITGSRDITALLGAVWLVAASLVALWTSYTPCPSCSAPFFTGALPSQFWAPRCGHCGLEL